MSRSRCLDSSPLRSTRRVGAWILGAAAALALLSACQGDAVGPTPAAAAEPPPAAVVSSRVAAAPAHSPAASQPAPEPSVETVDVPGDLPAFVVRDAARAAKVVFLPGFCSHGLPYAESFRHSAAEQGGLIAVQADRLCDDGSSRRWTNTREQLDARIVEAYRAAGYASPPHDLVMIGYSEGAVLAEMLAHLNPERYSRAILIGAPRKPQEFRFRHSRATAMLAGSIDRQDHLRAGARDLAAAGIPSAFFELPGAKHGEMGTDAEHVMGEALAFVLSHSREPAARSQ